MEEMIKYADSIIGMNIEDVKNENNIQSGKYTIRVTAETNNGAFNPFMVTMDYRVNRINLRLVDNIVESYTFG